jgi:PPOX class probable F420-dependent enzyme
MSDDHDVPFARDEYINLETFKRDGAGVKTPVWAAPLDGTLVVVSAGTSYKVKRLRRDPRIRAAACDVRGRVRGAWRDGTGKVLAEPVDVARAQAALRRKYGWKVAIGDFFARIMPWRTKRAYLALKF